MDESDSELSSLSSGLSEPDDDLTARLETEMAEIEAARKKPKGINRYFKPTPKDQRPASPEPPKRAPSPPHEFVLADNDAIAFIVMFRSRFSECFPTSLPHYGPQDIERGVGADVPDEHIERLLCSLLTLCLNRKKPVERGHYGRALEDAISESKNQWPKEWAGANPLSGGKSFNTMTAEERLVLLRTIILWCLHSSEIVSGAIKGAYKQTRREDDKNQPKAVQPWFTDSWRRKYYLIEGQDDTHFRIYRENDGRTPKTNVWFSVAGTIDEAKALAEKLEAEMPGNQGKLLAEKIRTAVPRWEAGEEKRRRKDYRLARKAAFARPEPGFGMYEGRTRGKRMRYTFGDDEQDFEADSSRAGSGRSTPFEDGAPVKTSSGRTVKSRLGGMYGESMLTDQRKEVERDRAAGSEDTDDVVGPNGRPVRKARATERAAASRGRYADGLDSDSESDAGAEHSGDEWDGNEDESDDEEPDAADFQESDDELMDEADEADDDDPQESLVVQLRYRKGALPHGQSGSAITNGINGHQKEPTRSSPLAQVETATDNTDSTRVNGMAATAGTSPLEPEPEALKAAKEETVSPPSNQQRIENPTVAADRVKTASREPSLVPEPPPPHTEQPVGSMDTS